MFHVKTKGIFSEKEFIKLLKNYLDIELSSKSQKNFEIYLNELRSWNKRINLISRQRDKPEDIYQHFLDSLLVFNAIQIPDLSKILDLGSGAGLPALPIKIIRGDLVITMVESIRMKVLFLKKVIEILELTGVELFHKRTEELQNLPEFKGKFDFVTAKAFGKLRETIFASYSFLKENGILIAYKGSSFKSELIEFLKDRQNFKLQIKDIKFIEIKEIGLKRFLVLIQKTS